ncbi:Transcription factor iws1 [Umbelopsis sp. WA50703]
MSLEDESAQAALNRELLEDSEDGISDLDDDTRDNEYDVEDKIDSNVLPANDDNAIVEPTLTADEDYNEEEDESQNQEEVTQRPKLPSFKKRQRENEDEPSEKIDLSEEIRLQRQKRAMAEDNGELEEEAEIDPQQAMREELDREFAAALATGKRKKKKVDEYELEKNTDEMMATLRDRMKDAAYNDITANEDKRPAISKLKMLNIVTTALSKNNLHEQFLENQILEAVKLWLEPLPDGSLPSLDIQSEMLDILNKLPIRTDNLRESGIGRVMFFYTKCPRIEPKIKRAADQLVAKWSRPILRRSADYREKRLETKEYRDDERSFYKRPRYNAPVEEAESESSNTVHARIPQALASDYEIVPQSTVRGDRMKGKNEGKFKRLKDTMRAMKSGPKRTTPKVSIEGKGVTW